MSHKDSQYLIEFREVGGSVKVTAVDPVSLEEVSIVGSPTVSKKQLSDLVVRKLLYVLEKKNKK